MVERSPKIIASDEKASTTRVNIKLSVACNVLPCAEMNYVSFQKESNTTRNKSVPAPVVLSVSITVKGCR